MLSSRVQKRLNRRKPMYRPPSNRNAYLALDPWEYAFRRNSFAPDGWEKDAFKGYVPGAAATFMGHHDRRGEHVKIVWKNR
jgi:hypothetical protein